MKRKKHKHKADKKTSLRKKNLEVTETIDETMTIH